LALVSRAHVSGVAQSAGVSAREDGAVGIEYATFFQAEFAKVTRTVTFIVRDRERAEDIRGLYETLKARGVTDFTQEPTDHFYGTDMGIRDPFGNAIRILQPAKAKAKATATA
jgi:uncharacterized glyoxalase superfamily protein PhnB